MPSKLEVISLGGRLARIPEIHMTVSGLSKAWQCREKQRDRQNKKKGRCRQNQIETEGGRDGWLGPEWWALLYLSSVTDSDRGSSGPVVIALCSGLILYKKALQVSTHTVSIFHTVLCFITLFLAFLDIKLLSFLSVWVLHSQKVGKFIISEKPPFIQIHEHPCKMEDDCTYFQPCTNTSNMLH